MIAMKKITELIKEKRIYFDGGTGAFVITKRMCVKKNKRY